MRIKKSIASLIIASFAILSLSGCGTKDNTTGKVSSSEPFQIGVSQLVAHAALDASYEGFVDALEEAGYIDGENIVIDYQNAQNDQSNTNTIASKFVNDNKDLILAIATPSAQAVVNATRDIPVLVTAVTDPAESGLVVTNEAPGGNVSGTSDLTPVRQQIELMMQLIPNVKKIAVLYCSSESNSKIQADMAIQVAEELGLTASVATVSNSNEIQQVVQSLVDKVDAIYAPTDNVIAAGMPTVAMVANSNGIPVICGEENMVDKGGLATFGINYYELGKLTGQQAVKIIEGEATTDQMPIEYLPEEQYDLTINEEVAQQLGIAIPQELIDKYN